MDAIERKITIPQHANRDEPYAIEYRCGGDFPEYVAYANTWGELQRAINDCDVYMIIVCASGEILFDVRDGWDIVTDGPPRL